MRNERERLSSSDDIDLIELVQGVWRQKIWVGLVAVPVIALGLAYVMLVSPVYEAKLYIQPPSQNEIAQLNYGRGEGTGLAPLSAKEVYSIYLKALQSEAVRDKFFRSAFLPMLTEEERGGSRDALYAQFNGMLKVALAGKDMPDRYVLTASLEDPRLAATWVSNYAEMAAERAKNELLSGARSDMSIMADNLDQQIRAARATASNQRVDQIAQLKEALRVARSIGLEKPPIISDTLSNEVSAGMNGALTYMRGTKALEAEIANLESRSSNDPFIQNLREKQEKLSFLRTLKVDPSLVAMYQQDGAVSLPDKPIKPRKAIIMLLSALVGVGLGVVVALGRDMWCRRRATSGRELP
ncbi:LPS O-antigen chain length determinant protein WzzB [Pseudomonas asiatica]|uniref:LPS O-antigen chain length determinant protein WzzB n=1 Tax=Pseudomonas asiatica TaxID=2219225 RepID=UPI001E37B1AA|nr:Wzz/FepE/Etk N-terminal domain-containing protein [Pseudomonas asiatica]MDM3874083.1 Wzz/FepE/Etk N-terminal domain-containing protein [Pseudomonas asiatica]